jgi:hypothetical protein
MIARPVVLSGVALLGVAMAVATAQDQKKKADDKPFGIYTYVKGMRGDQEIAKDRLEGNKVEIEKDEVTLIGPDGQEQFEISYTIDEDKDGVVKLSMKIVESVMEDTIGSTAKGLAKHEGDTITLIYDYESGKHPADFTPDGPSQHLFVLKKVADLKEDDDDKGKDDDDKDKDKDDRR